MRTSQYFIATLRDNPSDAETISHRLMIRAGLIRKLATGLYSWLPMGLRVLQKVETIIREEMNRAGALEILMPVVQPVDLWVESGRIEKYGPELLRFEDRHQRPYCLGPTHEEVVTDLVRQQIRSYKQLPINFYQIQTKFRDEIRPRFGVMRAREFTMKDAYSFHIDDLSLQQTYDTMYEAYTRIFTRMNLTFRAVFADTGSIGGNHSHEFHVLADSGEDAIALSDTSQYAANVELATYLLPDAPKSAPKEAFKLIETPNTKSIEEVCQHLKIAPENTIKTLIVKGTEKAGPKKLVALVLRGDHTLNEIKVEKIDLIQSPVTLASEEEVLQHLSIPLGFIGPHKLDIPIICDHSAAYLSDFVCGANIKDKHFIGANWDRDCSFTHERDIRRVVAGDPSPDGQGTLSITRGIEVGHIFQLGRKYSEALQATVLNDKGQKTIMTMGCYGIGVTRVVAAAIEQNNDEKGIIWPDSIAPFLLVIIPVQYQGCAEVKQTCDEIYAECMQLGISVLLDDRDERLGVLLADSELIGIPHRIVVGEKNLKNNMIEYTSRKKGGKENISSSSLINFLKEQLKTIA